MNGTVDRRAAYELLGRVPQGRFVEERPALFSPAVAAQDRANGSRLYFHWNPIFIPYEYTNWLEEAGAHTQSCYIGDWSAIGKIRISGPDAHQFLSYVGVVDLARIAINQAKHHVQVDADGLIASEGIVYRTAEQEFIYTGGGTDWTVWQFASGNWNAQVERLTADLFLFEIQGPTSLGVLERLFDTDLRDIGFNRSRVLDLAGGPIRILRTGVSGELGYELHGPADRAAEVWAKVVDAGAGLGIRQLGMRSQLVAHIEAGIATVGIDYLPSAIFTPGVERIIPAGVPSGSFVPHGGPADYFRYPGELGWGARVSLDTHDFIGRAALQAQAATGGPARRLMALEWNDEDVLAIHGALYGSGVQLQPQPQPMQMPRDISLGIDRVLVGGTDVGVSSSRTYSPTLRKMISLGVLDRSIEANREVTVIWGSPGFAQREIRATVRPAPLKPDKRRTDVRQER